MAIACDEGFTLVEVVVALFVAAGIFLSLTYGALASLQAGQTARHGQQAADIANQVIEEVRQLAWGSLGHDTVTCPDEQLSDCGPTAEFADEPLVVVTGGIPTQRETVTSNAVDYTVTSYVTEPDDDTGDYRRVTVIVAWDDHGRPMSRTATTLVSESTRGLPLPDFLLTPIGPVDAQVNPGATAFWGFRLTNQGAPDQWNLTTSGDISPVLYQDNGDDVFNPTTDTIVELTDSTQDGIPDTGRVDPQGSILFWAIHDVPACGEPGQPACSQILGQHNFSITAASVSQPEAASAWQTVAATLTVTAGLITASPTPTPTATPSSTGSPSPSTTPTPTPTGTASNPTCQDPEGTAHPDPALVAGFSRVEYTLHNSGNVAWPTLALPETGEIPGSEPLRSTVMNLAPDAIPTGRLLSPLSLPDDTPGRVLEESAAGFTELDADRIADWTTQSQSRTYTGSMVLRTYVDALPSATGDITLTAHVYQYRSSGGKVDELLATGDSERTRTISATGCEGFQQVSLTFPVSGTRKLGKNYVLGVRVWNSGTQPVRLAYDHADYHSGLTVVEQ